jgi:uncharacterized membrane protein YphA (DoxX/SURF4 family)
MRFIKSIYNHLRLKYDMTDVVFRVLFSLIFIGLGGEHIFSNQLIIKMMPSFIPELPCQILSVLSGILLLGCGMMIAVGYQVRMAATLLGIFLILVNLVIHGPALFYEPEGLDEQWSWLWQVYQRSNFVKNLCLFGVCLHLINHKLGRYSFSSKVSSQANS